MPFDNFSTGLTVFLATNVAKFKKDMNDAGASVEQFGSSVTGTLKGIVGVSQSIQAASIAAGLAMGGVAAVAAKAASDLETQMNNVATVWDEAAQKATGSFVSLGDATAELLDLSSQLPQTAVTLAEGLYDVASSGFQGADAMQVMTVSAMAASAGLTDTETAARGITTVLNAYGVGAEQAKKTSDVLFQTVNLGVITFEELSSVMGEFIGMAAQANVSIEDANAALATMTLAGMDAAEASTSLNRIMQSFIEPTTALAALLQQLGYESGAAALEQDGLYGVLTKVFDAVGDNVESYAALFDEIRAVRGVLALAAGSGQNYADIVGKMTDENALFNATQKALEKQAKSTGFQMTLLKNNVTAIAIEFGQVLLPIIRFAAEAVGDFAAGFRALPDVIKFTVAAGATLIGMLTVLGGLWVSQKITSLLFAAALKSLTGTLAAMDVALARFGLSTVFLTRVINGLSVAMTGLKIAMGVIGLVLAAASVAMMFFGRSQEDVTAGAETLKDTLDQATGAVTSQTAAFIRDKAVKEGWLEAAQTLEVSADDLTAALLGNEDAIARVNAARQGAVDEARNEMLANADNIEAAHQANHALNERIEASDKLEGALKDTNKQIKASEDAVIEEARANSADADTVKVLTTAEQQERKTAVARAEAHIAAVTAIQEEIDKTFDLANIIQELTKADEANTGGRDQGRRDRHQAAQDAMEDELDIERRGLDERQTIRKQALEDQQQAERDAFDRANAVYKRALEDRQEAEKDALDKTLRTRKNAFDDELRLQSQAHDDQMEELRDHYDELIGEEKDAWGKRKDELEWIIRTTWGVQRQAAIDALAVEEDAHEDRVDELEEAGDDAVRTETNKFDDRARAAKQGWDDIEKVEKAALADRQETEARAWDDLVELDADKMGDRHDARLRAFDKELTAERDLMDDRQEARKRGLDRIQQAEDDAADTRLSRSKEKHVPTMVEIQRQADETLRIEQKKNDDLAVIAQQGGEKINSTTLAQIAKLPPEIVAVIAASGPDAIKKLGETIQKGAEQANIDPIKNAFNRWGVAVGTSLTAGILKGIHDYLGLPPGVDPMDSLLGGALTATPAPEGDLRPIIHRADGGIAWIATAAHGIQWNEPETGGEAYIPLSPTKRGRSSGILAEVASHFGYGLIPMANGGILGDSHSSSVGVMNQVNVDLQVGGGVDPNAVAVAVRREVERALDGMARKVAVKSWRN